MENKYYTPEIEDLRVGYTLESNNLLNTNNSLLNGWGSITLEKEHYQASNDDLSNVEHIFHDLKEGKIRTKYLDKQDIESLGWKFNYLGKDDWFKGNLTIIAYNEIDYPFELWFKLDKYWLGFYKGVYKIVIIEKREGFPNNEIIKFSGNCPSINELKYIQKLLGIK